MNCVLLADRHRELTEGMRRMLTTRFACVFMVADLSFLREGGAWIQPTLAVIDRSLAGGNLKCFLVTLRRQASSMKALLVTAYDEPMLTVAALTAGVDGVMHTRAVASGLPQAVKFVLAGELYPSLCTKSPRSKANQ